MSEHAIAQVTEAFKARLESVIGGDTVYVGAPNKTDVGDKRASLFLFHIDPNAELRNEARLSSAPAQGPATILDALPLDLRYLLTVFRTGTGNLVDPNELTTLGQIIRVLHAEPTLAGETVPGQTVRISLDPYPMEEMSRIWGLFPGDSYRTSVVYLASPVFVEAGPVPVGPPVRRREARAGVSTEAPDSFGRALEEGSL